MPLPELPLVTWETFAEVVPVAENPECCEVKFQLIRYDTYADRVEKEVHSPKVLTLWGEPAELKIFLPQSHGGGPDSALLFRQGLPEYDKNETDGFSCKALPVRNKDGTCKVTAEFYVKKAGQTIFRTKQILIFSK